MTINCILSNRHFLKEECVVSISGTTMGDKYTDVYYLCPVCRSYTVALWRYNYTGEETVSLFGPLLEKEGYMRIAIINRCSEPWDKKCRCDAHREYFNNALD